MAGQTYLRAFEPFGSTVNLAVLATTGNVAVTNPGNGNRTIRIANIGSNTIFINIGDSTVTTATTTGVPILPNSVETFFLRRENTHVAAIAGTTGNTMYVTTGESQ